jgi:hypothetical protein
VSIHLYDYVSMYSSVCMCIAGMDRLWTYSFTTAGNTQEKMDMLENHRHTPIMAGFAHGLCVCVCVCVCVCLPHTHRQTSSWHAACAKHGRSARTCVLTCTRANSGLPLSRIHARAFGGDLQVMSMQGHGTDVYIYLWKLGDREVAVP